MDETIFSISPDPMVPIWAAGGRVSLSQPGVTCYRQYRSFFCGPGSNQRRYRELLAVTGLLTRGNVGQDRAIINFKTRSPTCKHCIIIKYDPERG